jgi:hypothetical protein
MRKIARQHIVATRLGPVEQGDFETALKSTGMKSADYIRAAIGEKNERVRRKAAK